jgi:hypothetical protein
MLKPLFFGQGYFGKAEEFKAFVEKSVFQLLGLF